MYWPVISAPVTGSQTQCSQTQCSHPQEYSGYMQSSFAPSECSTEAGHLGTTNGGTGCVDRGPPEGPHLYNWGPRECGQSLVGVGAVWIGSGESQITDSKPRPHSPVGGRLQFGSLMSDTLKSTGWSEALQWRCKSIMVFWNTSCCSTYVITHKIYSVQILHN